MIHDREYDDSSYNNKLQKEDQIPTEYNQEKTLRVIRKQNHIPGEGKRSKTINDMPLTATLARVLKDLEFPANKNEIVEFVSIKPEYLSPKICQTMNNQSMILWLFYYTIYHTSSFIIELRLIAKTRSFPA